MSALWLKKKTKNQTNQPNKNKQQKQEFIPTVEFNSQMTNRKLETRELQREDSYKNMDIRLQGKINRIEVNKNNHMKISFQNYMLL